MRTWDDVWSVPDGWYPNEFVVRFLAKYVKKRTGLNSYKVHRPDVNWILDLGCGCGRHLVMLAREGYEATGIDVSSSAVEFARHWLAHEGLQGWVATDDARRLHWLAGTFDAVIAEGVLDHMRRADAVRAAAEVRRVLRPAGLFYCSLMATGASEFGKGEQVGPCTERLTSGPEQGLLQTYYTEHAVRELLENFTLLDLVYSEWYPVHGIGLSEPEAGRPLRLARWHAVCEVPHG